MKQILFIILAIVFASCKGTDHDMHLKRCQYFIYNKSSHNTKIIEQMQSSDSIVHTYYLPVNDSIKITTEYNDDLVLPFGFHDAIIVFDDSIKFNCGTHDYKMCSHVGMYKPKFSNDTITAMEYIITDEDYDQVVSILSEEQ